MNVTEEKTKSSDIPFRGKGLNQRHLQEPKGLNVLEFYFLFIFRIIVFHALGMNSCHCWGQDLPSIHLKRTRGLRGDGKQSLVGGCLAGISTSNEEM